jgi:2-polyprenyl-3-methyl-5-hydroxy-6-metoxy-1,4-benzoquinol methylase
MESFFGGRKKYNAKYFASEYRAQYGRTYLEDFESIKFAAKGRVAIIRRLIRPNSKGVVLDVGCAYGPFLSAVVESGLDAFGLDVSPEAVTFVTQNLHVPALCTDFQSVARGQLPRKIAALTMWYVLEHFPAAGAMLAKSASLLQPGGVLALSTPNGRGISARRDIQGFLFNSPKDHFTVFSPRKLSKILLRYGLTLRKIRITGHHPERFPGALGAAAQRWALVAHLLHAASVLLGLGDTFEAYAVKGAR